MNYIKMVLGAAFHRILRLTLIILIFLLIPGNLSAGAVSDQTELIPAPFIVKSEAQYKSEKRFRNGVDTYRIAQREPASIGGTRIPTSKPPKTRNPGLPLGGLKIIIDLSKQSGPSKEPEKKSTKKRVQPKKRASKTTKKTRKSRTVTTRPSVTADLPIRRDKEIVVLLDAAQPDNLAAELAQIFQLELVDRFDSQVLDGSVQRYRVVGSQSVDEIVAALQANDQVEAASYNSIYYAQQQKGSASQFKAQYAIKKIKLESAHETRGQDVLVAVIDSGVDLSHPDISASISDSYNAVQGTEYRAHSHGTAIAGIISANGEVQGVAPMAKLLAVRAFFVARKDGIPETSSFILLRGLDWAFGHDARIFNLSFAGPHDRIVKRMLNKLYKKGAILIAAAGNGGAKASPAYPAAYRHVMAVTAIDQTDKLYPKANRGRYLSVSAPGVDILVTSPEKKYKFSSGTSLAAAHVSGLVALLREKDPNLSAKDIQKIVMSTAFDLGPKGYDRNFGAGRVDATASLLRLNKLAGRIK